jgi:Raf kinase inhibitor-like YbhB/YbcL family protein
MVWHTKTGLILGILAIVFLMTTLGAFSRRMFKKGGDEQVFMLTSPAFEHEEDIPPFYTCDGNNFSPALEWKNPPKDTQSFVLICHDPDALGGDWIHWIVYNIPKTITKFPEHVIVETLNAKSGLNSWDSPTYGGPCPPLKQHRYIFTLYALNIPQLEFKEPPRYNEIIKAMEGHILDKALLIGLYQRVKSI